LADIEDGSGWIEPSGFLIAPLPPCQPWEWLGGV